MNVLFGLYIDLICKFRILILIRLVLILKKCIILNFKYDELGFFIIFICLFVYNM